MSTSRSIYGTLKSHTWYYTYVIVNDSGCHDCLISQDSKKATKKAFETGPGTYYLSAFRTDENGEIMQFIQHGDEFTYG